MGAQIANIITQGAIQGCIIGLIGAGFVILYRATGVISFAQGSFMVIGALLFQTTGGHVEFYADFLLVGAMVFVLGGLTYRLVFARLVGTHHLVTAIATVGLGTMLDAEQFSCGMILLRSRLRHRSDTTLTVSVITS